MARLKITFLYFVLSTIILGAVGYLIYSDPGAVVRNLLLLALTAVPAYVLAGVSLRPLTRAMERQKRFMASISHELRTPLSIMRTTNEAALLGGNQLTSDELAEVVTSNLGELDRMSRIIEFLLHFSSFENRLSRLRLSTIDLVYVAKKAAGEMKPLAEKKNITLAVSGPPAATVHGNAAAIEEMILHVLRNAIAYTPEAGSVDIHVRKTLGSCTLSIEDSGVGIFPRDLPNIFEAFYRGASPDKSSEAEQGIGLGLAIAKEIAHFHGATIVTKSVVREGTTMTVHFPSRFASWFTLP